MGLVDQEGVGRGLFQEEAPQIRLRVEGVVVVADHRIRPQRQVQGKFERTDPEAARGRGNGLPRPGIVLEHGAAGFREAGEAGKALEDQIRAELRAYPGLRVIGPNCLGVIVPGVKLNASFATAMPGDGHRTFGDVLPFDDVEGGAARTLGRFVRYCETLFDAAAEIQGTRDPEAFQAGGLALRCVLPIRLRIGRRDAVQLLHDLLQLPTHVGQLTDVAPHPPLVPLRRGRQVAHPCTAGIVDGADQRGGDTIHAYLGD